MPFQWGPYDSQEKIESQMQKHLPLMYNSRIYIQHTDGSTLLVLKFHGRLIREKCLRKLFGEEDDKNG